MRPMFSLRPIAIATLGLVTITACGERARQSVAAGTGPMPKLLEPRRTMIPTINVVEAKSGRWGKDGEPRAANGLAVVAFARGLDHPRWLHVLPNGDVLVAETNAPPRPEDGKGIRGWFFKRYQRRAGGAVASANRIMLVRDADGDGVAEKRWVLADSLNSPFGMALVGNELFVANTDALVRLPYRPGDTVITAAPVVVTALPAGRLNHHWTKGLIASLDGSKLYVAIGSNSNVAENGIDKETDRAMIWEVDRATGAHRVYASGLRNPVGMTWVPTGDSPVLWTSVNERDELGSDLVPDYMTSVRRGGFYGWPYSYYGSHVDDRVKPTRPDLVATAIVPDYALGPHTASLGLVFAARPSLPAPYGEGMFIGQHGSWNREPRSGYKVIFVAFQAGRPTGDPVDVLTGFVNDEGVARGRPVGVALDRTGALLVADDVGNVVWRVSSAGVTASR